MTMPKIIDLTEQVFGKLTVLRQDGMSGTNKAWLCRCECGTETRVAGNNLRAGNTVSCGCYRAQKETTHGMSKTRVYSIWRNMINRCTLESSTHYANYGGRGIVVVQRWLESFEAFYADMGEPPSELHTIERHSSNGHYSPENCKWAIQEEQQNNRTNNRLIECNGRRQTLSQWSKERNLHRNTISTRLSLGWSVAQALGFSDEQTT
jgi:hypothetical protein